MRTTASPIPEQEKGSDFSYVPEPHERMRLGQSFGNPYSLASIQRAYDTLLALQGETEFPRLNPTHLYIRFLPRDTGEYNALRRVGLELFSYPLDRIPSTGLAPYHDPTLPPSAITWQYTTIQVGQSIPDVLHEVLEECFLPPGANGSDPNVPGQIEETIWRYVELISLFQHGLVNELDLEDFDEVEDAPVSLRLLGKNNTRFNPFGWFWKKIKKILPTIRFPQGTIRVYDTQDAGYVSAQRLRVRCHLGVYWSSTRTDRNGHYVMSTGFLVSPYYSLHFDYAEGVSLWGNWAFFAEATYYAGFHSRAGYSRDVGREAGIWDWITVGNAVVYYYDYCDQFGIMPPPGGLKIAVFTKWRVAATCMLHHVRQPMAFMTNKHWINFFSVLFFYPLTRELSNLLFAGLPDLVIGTPGYNSRDVFGTTCHELSHASHFSQVGSMYWRDDMQYVATYGAYGDGTGKNAGVCAVVEMWGYAMEVYLTKRRYGIENTALLRANWFKPSKIYKLMVHNELSSKEIFDCLTPHIRSVEGLRQALFNAYPNKIDLIYAAFQPDLLEDF